VVDQRTDLDTLKLIFPNFLTELRNSRPHIRPDYSSEWQF